MRRLPEALDQLNLTCVIRIMLRNPDYQLTDRPSLSTRESGSISACRYFRDSRCQLRVFRLEERTSSAHRFASAWSGTCGKFAGERGKRAPTPPSSRRRTA